MRTIKVSLAFEFEDWEDAPVMRQEIKEYFTECAGHITVSDEGDGGLSFSPTVLYVDVRELNNGE